MCYRSLEQRFEKGVDIFTLRRKVRAAHPAACGPTITTGGPSHANDDID